MRRCLLLLALLACHAMGATPTPDAPHDALQAVGPQSAHIVELWRIFIGTCSVVFAAVLAVFLWILWRRPRAGEDAAPDLSTLNRPEPRSRRRVTAAVAASTLLLLLLVVASVFTDRALARMSLANAVTLEVTAHQWWWTVRYLDADPSQEVETANEIHVPVGRPVVVQLKSDDVIHSLWLPNLAGKRDLIPGRTAMLQFQADKAGAYRGQCAEFCGFQHALMAVLVVAEPQERFDAWLNQQRTPAPAPTGAQALRGQQLFQTLSCAMCHAVQGTQAAARRGPDLTHIASRQTLAASTLANTPENLASWIREPQQHKPGTNMPATPMSADDLQALVAYLGGLK